MKPIISLRLFLWLCFFATATAQPKLHTIAFDDYVSIEMPVSYVESDVDGVHRMQSDEANYRILLSKTLQADRRGSLRAKDTLEAAFDDVLAGISSVTKGKIVKQSFREDNGFRSLSFELTHPESSGFPDAYGNIFVIGGHFYTYLFMSRHEKRLRPDERHHLSGRLHLRKGLSENDQFAAQTMVMQEDRSWKGYLFTGIVLVIMLGVSVVAVIRRKRRKET